MDMHILLSELAREEYCYLTTTGRVSGRPHGIEIWFGVRDGTVYLLSGSRTSDWLKNLRRQATVTVRIGEHTFTGTARVVRDPAEDAHARTLVAEKYQEWEEGKELSQWARTALPVAIDVTARVGEQDA